MAKADCAINNLHGVYLIDSEIAADALPQIALGSGFGLGFLEEPAAHLLDLINQKCHHHDGKDTTEIIFTQSIIMAKVVSLIFQGIKGLICDTPTGTPGSHDVVDIVFGNFQVGYPTETGGLAQLVVDLPVLEKINQNSLVSFVQWNSFIFSITSSILF